MPIFHDARKRKVIDNFDGVNEFLSNYFPSAIIGKDDGIKYPTVEHYFQAHKTMDLEDRQKIADAHTPGMAKRAGRAIDLRPDWEKVKDSIMWEAVLLKFSIPELKEKLIKTGNAQLIEGNTWHDNYWGDCKCENCANRVGYNRLGGILMTVRQQIGGKR